MQRVAAMHSCVKQKTLPADGFLPFVDKYGQFAHDDWPGKIHDDAELEASRKAEDAWLSGLCGFSFKASRSELSPRRQLALRSS